MPALFASLGQSVITASTQIIIIDWEKIYQQVMLRFQGELTLLF